MQGEKHKAERGMRLPRVLLTAGASGSGKTLITCGILQAFIDRGLSPVSFKCGPDYIDPMFHSTVLGTPSRNLDTFFTGEETTRYLFAKNAAGADLSVIEGVMGYYDGLGGISTRASAYDVARVTDTPAVLIVDCRGMSVSILPYIKGFLEYRRDSGIRGVILNRMSAMLYPRISEMIREELQLVPLGYVPWREELTLESRHLGLVLPEEIEGIRDKLHALAAVLEETLDLDALLRLANEAPPMEGGEPEELRRFFETEAAGALQSVKASRGKRPGGGRKPVIAVARDEAFCFLYEDNLELLKRCGAKLIYFSPIHDRHLPPADGLLLCGGYPELSLKALSENVTMRREIREAVTGGLPCMAECGGFMYLQREMEDMEGNSYPVAGVLPGRAFRTKRLGRFGYISLRPNPLRQDSSKADPMERRLSESDLFGQTSSCPQMLGQEIGEIRGHEFHYFDTTENGAAFHASKPLRGQGWDCIWGSETLIAGFPHLYYYSNPRVALRFVEACRNELGEKRMKDGAGR